jgi:hypothetical protein
MVLYTISASLNISKRLASCSDFMGLILMSHLKYSAYRWLDRLQMGAKMIHERPVQGPVQHARAVAGDVEDVEEAEDTAEDHNMGKIHMDIE